MNKIMDMPVGTRIKFRKNGHVYMLGEYVNDKARILHDQTYIGMHDYINENTQKDYEVV